jgi:signal peptidase II
LIGLAFVLGGAVGNLIDRIFLGGVRDFIRFDFFDFPVFNIADSFLTVGCVMLAVFILFLYRPKGENKNGKKS